MKPFYTVIIKNKAYRLRLTMGIILEYEQLNEKMLCTLNYETDTEDMVLLLWLMMRQNKDMSFDEAIEILTSIDDSERIHAFTALRIAVDISFTNKTGNSNPKADFFDFTGYSRMAAEMGISQSDLWDMTHAEFSEVQEGFIRRCYRERNQLITSAWYTVYFGLQLNNNKHMEKLSDYLTDPDEQKLSREQTDEQMMNACKTLVAIFGGEVIEQ